jgi:hypothetical protein
VLGLISSEPVTRGDVLYIGRCSLNRILRLAGCVKRRLKVGREELHLIDMHVVGFELVSVL